MRLSRSLCSIVGEAIAGTGSHASLESLFLSAGALGPPPDGPHTSKWKEWLYRTGQDESVDGLAVLGGVLEEFMDLPPREQREEALWRETRTRIDAALEENGLRYFRFGRVIPQGEGTEEEATRAVLNSQSVPARPAQVEELLETIVKGLRRAMHPLTHRRRGLEALAFSNEYDVQDLLHAMLRPWISDIRPEEFTPSYAGVSTRMDFLLPRHGLVIETKIIRDRAHARRVGDELIIDVEHYRRHPECRRLWCVVYDPHHLITNSESLRDLEGTRSIGGEEVTVRVFVL